MRLIKNFNDYKKINETGEWSRDIDWEYVKNNPDDKDEFPMWIRQLEDDINILSNKLKSGLEIIIKDIRGFDAYQGPYANVDFKTKSKTIPCKIWTFEYGIIFDKCNNDVISGLEGTVDHVAEILNEKF